MAKTPSLFDRVLDALFPARARASRLAQDNARLEAFLRAVPVEYCGWSDTGAQALSPGFGKILGLSKIDGIEDVQAAITAGDAAALEGLFDRLQQTGEPFDISVNTVIGSRTLRLFGRRGAIEGEAQVFSVLWIYDITDFARASMRSMEAITSVEKREGELRDALNALPFPVWLRTQKLDLAWCNRFYTRMVDDTPAAVIAEQKFLPLTGGKSEGRERALAQMAVARGAAQSARGHTIVDGQRRLIEITEIPMPTDKGIVGVAIDITREEEWETAHRQMIASYHEAMEQLRTAIAMFDRDTRIEFYNSAYEQLTGLSGAWLNAKPKIGEILDKMRESRKLPEQADYKTFKQVWAGRFTSLLAPLEEMQYLPDGTVVRMIVTPRPMGGLLVTMEDVTSRLQLESSFNTLLAVQQETLDTLAEGIVVFGEDGRLKLSNPAFAAAWNLGPDDLSGSPHVSQLAEKIKRAFPAAGQDTARRVIVANGLERDIRRGRLERQDGKTFEYSVSPLPDGNVMNAYFDITDSLKVEQVLREKNAALEEAERLKADFLANVSYQLRTPLNALMGFAEILHQQYFGPLNARQIEYTTSMIEAGQRLASLINDILDLSSIEAGHLKLYPTDIRVLDLIERVTALTGDWARKQRLGIVIDCPDPALTLVADERRLKQVLLNLISNAFNYSPEGGTVTVSAAAEGDTVALSVRDTGIGIPEAELARIFTPFDKINSGRTDRRSGAGLGLTLVKSIVELHGGTVAIQSRSGAGTQVTARLPRAALARISAAG